MALFTDTQAPFAKLFPSKVAYFNDMNQLLAFKVQGPKWPYRHYHSLNWPKMFFGSKVRPTKLMFWLSEHALSKKLFVKPKKASENLSKSCISLMIQREYFYLVLSYYIFCVILVFTVCRQKVKSMSKFRHRRGIGWYILFVMYVIMSWTLAGRQAVLLGGRCLRRQKTPPPNQWTVAEDAFSRWKIALNGRCCHTELSCNRQYIPTRNMPLPVDDNVTAVACCQSSKQGCRVMPQNIEDTSRLGEDNVLQKMYPSAQQVVTASRHCQIMFGERCHLAILCKYSTIQKRIGRRNITPECLLAQRVWRKMVPNQ